MTILKDGRDRQLECEECAETTEVYDKDDFDLMIADAKRAGWTIRLSGSSYTHTCSGCSRGSKLARQRALLGG